MFELFELLQCYLSYLTWFRRNSNLHLLFITCQSLQTQPGEILASGWKEALKYQNAAIYKHDQLVFCCVIKKLLIFNICEIYSEVMWGSCKRRSGTQLGQWYKASNWSSLRSKYFSKIARDINVLKLWTKRIKNVGNLGRYLPSATSAKVLAASVRAYAAGDGPYHRDSPNTRNSLRFDRKYIIVMIHLV